MRYRRPVDVAVAPALMIAWQNHRRKRHYTTPRHQPAGIPEAFVRTIKRDYVRVSPCPDRIAVREFAFK